MRNFRSQTVSVQREKLESIGEIPQCDRQTKDGRTYPAERQVERKATEPELPISPPRIISIQVAAPSQVNRVAEKASAVLEALRLHLFR